MSKDNATESSNHKNIWDKTKEFSEQTWDKTKEEAEHIKEKVFEKKKHQCSNDNTHKHFH